MITKDAMLHTGAKLFECSIIDCNRVTTNPFNPDPRLRWVTGYSLKDWDGQTYQVTLCPHHVKECLDVDEDFFVKLENTEKYIRENIN